MEKKADKLTVLEYQYAYGAWSIDPNDHSRVKSQRKPFSCKRRSVDDYRLWGVYEKAGIPYEILEITGKEYPDLEPYQAIPLSFSNQCEQAVRQGRKVLLASGYCAFAPAVVGGLQKALGMEKRIGVVWMDAHSDNKIVETTESTDLRFVGFPLSAIAGQTMKDWAGTFCRLEQPCRGQDILVSDARCSGKEGIENLKKAGSILVSEREFDNSELWRRKVNELSERVDALFLMVDADILKSSCIPAYFRQEPGGHDVETVMENIRIVMGTGKVYAFACFCIDFDKYEEGGDVTYLSGMRMIGAGLEAWR